MLPDLRKILTQLSSLFFSRHFYIFIIRYFCFLLRRTHDLVCLFLYTHYHIFNYHDSQISLISDLPTSFSWCHSWTSLDFLHSNISVARIKCVWNKALFLKKSFLLIFMFSIIHIASLHFQDYNSRILWEYFFICFPPDPQQAPKQKYNFLLISNIICFLEFHRCPSFWSPS